MVGGRGVTPPRRRVRAEPCCELSANRRIELISNLPTPPAALPARLAAHGENGSKKEAMKAYWSNVSLWKLVHWSVIALGCVSVYLHQRYRADFSEVRRSQSDVIASTRAPLLTTRRAMSCSAPRLFVN